MAPGDSPDRGKFEVVFGCRSKPVGRNMCEPDQVLRFLQAVRFVHTDILPRLSSSTAGRAVWSAIGQSSLQFGREIGLHIERLTDELERPSQSGDGRPPVPSRSSRRVAIRSTKGVVGRGARRQNQGRPRESSINDHIERDVTPSVPLQPVGCTASPTPSSAASSTASPTPSPTASPTPSSTASPTPSPTASPTPSPTATHAASPTALPPATPTATPTASPIATPTATPAVSAVVEHLDHAALLDRPREVDVETVIDHGDVAPASIHSCESTTSTLVEHIDKPRQSNQPGKETEHIVPQPCVVRPSSVWSQGPAAIIDRTHDTTLATDPPGQGTSGHLRAGDVEHARPMHQSGVDVFVNAEHTLPPFRWDDWVVDRYNPGTAEPEGRNGAQAHGTSVAREGSIDEPEGDDDPDDCESDDSDVDMEDTPAPVATKRGLLREALRSVMHLLENWNRQRDCYENIPARLFEARTRQPFLEWAQAATAQTLVDTNRHAGTMAARAELMKRILQAQTASFYANRKDEIRADADGWTPRRAKRVKRADNCTTDETQSEKYEIGLVLDELVGGEAALTEIERKRARDMWKRNLLAGRRWIVLWEEQGLPILLLNPKEHLGWGCNLLDRLNKNDFDMRRRELATWDDLTDVLELLGTALNHLFSEKVEAGALDELPGERREATARREEEGAAQFESAMKQLAERHRQLGED